MKVQIIVSLDSQIPVATKLDVAEQASEKLKNLDFEYQTLPVEVDDKWIEVNKDPISANLDTFKDLDEAMKSAELMHEDMKSNTLGRPSEEQGGDRTKNKYNEDRDPFNIE